MSVHTDLRTYFDTQWADRTKIIFPNISSEEISGSYTDTSSIIEFFILNVDARAIGLPVNATVPTYREYILQVNIMTPKNIGDGTALGHAERLDAIFTNKTITQGSYTYHFRTPIYRPPLPNDLVYNMPWECTFFVFIDP